MPFKWTAILQSALLMLFVTAAPLFAATNLSLGLQAGIMPSPGGNLHSSYHDEPIGVYNGIDGINRSLSGYQTKPIDKLLGISGGLEFRAVFSDYFFARLAGNITKSVSGGKGTTLYDNAGSVELIDCKYSIFIVDAPLTAGLAVPFWKDVRIAFSVGIAFAYGKYINSFETELGDTYKGKFAGYGFPLVFLIEGDYFLNEELSFTASLARYRGSTNIRRDSYTSDGDTDYARIDFGGYRFALGLSRHFYFR